MPKVVSLQLAQELDRVAKEHGIKLPEAELYHLCWHDTAHAKKYSIEDREGRDEFMKYFSSAFPAYQTDELLEILPAPLRIRKRRVVLDDRYDVYSPLLGQDKGGFQFSMPLLRDALARLAIHLIEERMWSE